MEKKMQRLRFSSSTFRNVAISSGSTEMVGRYGSAAAEFVKAYTGIDNETGVRLAKGLKRISEYKVSTKSSKDAANNIKQQAGFSAEVQTTAQTNAENIINGRAERVMRSDDHPDFGTNHPIYDHIEVDAHGVYIPGSGSQMKFVNDTEELLKNIAQGKGGGSNDKSRYLNAKLDLPSEQVAGAVKFCDERAKALREQADRLEALGKAELAAEKRAQAANYDTVKGNIRDSGLTTRQALFLRKHPELATAFNITRTSHRAGVRGAEIGALFGGAISAVTNVIAVHQGDKELEQAILDTVADTGKAAAAGYGTAFVGTAVKGVMQQSANATTRSLARTSLPSMVVTVCLEVGSAVRQYVRGEIDEVEFLETIGERGSGLLASGLFTAVGQVVIPIPVVGGAIGGMIGYTLSSMLYQDALAAFKDAREAHENYLEIKEYCEVARASLEGYRLEFRTRFVEWLDDGRAEIADSISSMDAAVLSGRIDDFAASANSLAALMGKTLQFVNRSQFDDFMTSDSALVL
ncbi:hypothetical protein [Azospirillum rugosum]|uniref:Uncharacterized protein n=1 Tax=Azospirillum rugosum TaxID=416170 RepID=A0ABS4SXP5_9PROT|nr:hypothetical protein [Azospirillum rugosum]MBP2297315.1 hypothetical protein [Azospirillum rugosum]MDQ0531157.1 hypothetical protein [Azospirillum rugosum]